MLKWDGDRAIETIRQRAKALEAEVAERLHANATIEVPVDTGALMESGDVRDIGDSTIVAYPIFYAHFVEFGTRDHAPNAFLRRAIEATLPEARGILGIR